MCACACVYEWRETARQTQRDKKRERTLARDTAREKEREREREREMNVGVGVDVWFNGGRLVFRVGSFALSCASTPLSRARGLGLTVSSFKVKGFRL